MGNKNKSSSSYSTPSLNEPQKLLKDYWVKSERGRLTLSQDNRAIEACFNAYSNGQNKLNKTQAMNYITDLLTIGGLRNRIEKEAIENGFSDPKEYYDNYVETIFKEMDINSDGEIQMTELLKPKHGVWRNFLNLVSIQVLHEMRKETVDNEDSDEEDDDDENNENKNKNRESEKKRQQQQTPRKSSSRPTNKSSDTPDDSKNKDHKKQPKINLIHKKL